jgi:hypothetical protein
VRVIHTADRHGKRHAKHRLPVFVPDPHTEFRTETLRQGVTAHLGRGLDGFVFGGVQVRKLDARIITAEAVPPAKTSK